MSEINVPLSRPSIDEDEIELVADVIRSGWLAHGEYNHKFEDAFAELVGVEHAISVNSCTSALELAIRANGIRGEVVMPSFTWVASANSAVVSGATPVFCEVDPVTRNVTADTLVERITERTEAVMVVHFGGQPCRMAEIEKLCADRGLLLIEDSAETIGATSYGRQVGSFGVGCFSFFPTKNITTGEGGMFTCGDSELATRVRAMIGHGVTSSTFERERAERPWIRAAEMPGHNFRMPNPLAALGYTQIRKLPELNRRRVEIARLYGDALAQLPVMTPVVAEDVTHVYQMYTLEVDEKIRNQVVHKLREAGIGASVHFDPPVHLQPAYTAQGSREGELPITEGLCGRLVTLPMYPDMTPDDVDAVAGALERILT
jgi:perosamine synthetase